jgi:hypothetical protein
VSIDDNSDMPENIRQIIASRKKHFDVGGYIKTHINFIFAYIFIDLLMFGYIANSIPRTEVANSLLFLWRYVWSDVTPLLIFFAIVFIVCYSEVLQIYAMKTGFWLGVAVILTSWSWYSYIFKDVQLFAVYFSTYEGYLTISLILGLGIIAGYLANFIKRFIFLRRKEEIDLMKKLRSEGTDNEAGE